MVDLHDTQQMVGVTVKWRHKAQGRVKLSSTASLKQESLKLMRDLQKLNF